MPNIRIRPWLVVTLAGLVYALAVVVVKGDPYALVTIGTRFSEDVPAEAGGTEGYDGQFVYFIARDPATAAQYLDVPAYRFQRILLPLLGRILSLGQESLIPWALLVANLIALAAGTALVERFLNQANVSRWYALGYGLTLGTVGATRLSLPEPLAYGLALGGVWLALRERWLWSAVLFALAALAKETTLVFPAACALFLLTQRRWQTVAVFGAVVGLPFVVWQLALYAQLGAFGVGSGGALATSFEVIPFMGVIRILTEGGPLVLLIFLLLLGPFVLLPTLWGLWKSWQDYRTRQTTFYTGLLFLNAALMAFVPFSTYREPLGILRFIVGLQIAVILYAAERRRLRALLNSTIWIMTLVFVVFSDFAPSESAAAAQSINQSVLMAPVYIMLFPGSPIRFLASRA